jgi:hypothetical protein
LAILYKPFYLETNTDPETLEPLGENTPPGGEIPPEEPRHEVIMERDGIHFINHRLLSPETAARETLDPDFLDLVESVIKPAKPGAP